MVVLGEAKHVGSGDGGGNGRGYVGGVGGGGGSTGELMREKNYH